jgi:hypothetical protein
LRDSPNDCCDNALECCKNGSLWDGLWIDAWFLPVQNTQDSFKTPSLRAMGEAGVLGNMFPTSVTMLGCLVLAKHAPSKGDTSESFD